MLNVEINGGQGQSDAKRAEDGCMERVSDGGLQADESGKPRQVYLYDVFNSQRQFKVLYIMHEVSENRKTGEDSEDF